MFSLIWHSLLGERKKKATGKHYLLNSRVISTAPSQYPDGQGKSAHVHFGTKGRHKIFIHSA